MTIDTQLITLIIGAPATLAGAYASPLCKGLRDRQRKQGEFNDAWFGSREKKDRSGAVTREAQPGMQAVVLGLVEDMRFVKAQLSPNGGSSVKDSVTRVEHKVTALQERQAEIATTAEAAARAAATAADSASVIAERQHRANEQSERTHTAMWAAIVEDKVHGAREVPLQRLEEIQQAKERHADAD